jgi:hypothetical protein
MPPVPSPAGTTVSPGQPPIGSSPVTQPTQNTGYNIAGMKMIGMAVMALEQAMPLLGAGSEAGKDVLGVIGRLSKHAPPGTVTSNDVTNLMQTMLMKQRQFGQQMQMMRQQQGQGQGQGQSGQSGQQITSGGAQTASQPSAIPQQGA